MTFLRGRGRGRAFLRFLFAIAWLIVAYFLADRAAHGFTHGAVFPLVRNLFEIFLLIIGFSYMEMAWDDAREPIRAMGLAGRPGGLREFGVGAAMGWGMVVAVFVVIALAGHFYVQLWTTSRAWKLLLLNLAILGTTALAAEIAFRGYPFQKLIQAAGPFAATLIAGAVFALLKLQDPAATPTAMWVSGMAAILLSIGYLRTRALWFPWGVHFAWLACIGILFGQPLAGTRQSSSVIRTYVDGPSWLTGNEYGPEASVVALIVLWIGLYVVARVTAEFAGRGTSPRLEADGPLPTPFIPVAPISAPPAEPKDRPTE